MGEHETFWDLLPAMLLGGVGMSRRDGPDHGCGDAVGPPDKAGVGSAVLNSMRQVGGSLGIAIMGAIVAASATPGVRNPSAFIDGFHHALLTAAGLTVARRPGRRLDARAARARHEPERAVAFEAG